MTRIIMVRPTHPQKLQGTVVTHRGTMLQHMHKQPKMHRTNLVQHLMGMSLSRTNLAPDRMHRAMFQHMDRTVQQAPG